jgi:outer membrane protein OmpA-like peptidoglycan-associated protein
VLGYLIEMGFKKEDISICIGKGKIERPSVNGDKGIEADRKVEIIVAPGLVQNTPKATPAKKLTELKRNETMALKNLNFHPGSPVLLSTSLPELDNLAKTLLEHNDINIRIEGHVCCIGPIARIDSPELISLRRAAAVYRYLLEKGISKSRMSFVGLGNINPVVKEEITEADRVLNRRVEIRVLNKGH